MRDRTDPDAWKRAREIASKYPFRGATPPHPRSYKIKTAPELVRLKERLVEEIRAEALKVAVDA
jgi:hypothetical protein